jgi:PAS domain S-box-containing protein
MCAGEKNTMIGLVFPEESSRMTADMMTKEGPLTELLMLRRRVAELEAREALSDTSEKKTEEEALLVGEEKYRRIFEHAIEGIFQSTPDGRLITVNPAYARMFGYGSPEEMISEVTDIACQLYANPADREEVKQRFDDPVPLTNYEVESLRKDGTHFWLAINARSVRDESGRILYYEGMTEDITARKEAEEALRKSEERYRNLVENIEDVICTHDLSGDLLFVNQAPAEVFGYSPDDLIGTNLRDHLLPGVRDQFDAYLAAIKNDGHASGLMLVQTRRGEKRVWDYRNRLRTEGPGAPIVQGLARDITERKRTEDALREIEQEYQRLFEDAIDGICMTKTDGTIVEANQAFMDLFGYRREELVGGSLPAIYVDPQDWTRLRQVIDQQGFVKDYPTRFQRKDVTEIDGHVTLRVRLNREGTIIGYRGMIRDVTEQNKLERELIQAQKMQAIGLLPEVLPTTSTIS